MVDAAAALREEKDRRWMFRAVEKNPESDRKMKRNLRKREINDPKTVIGIELKTQIFSALMENNSEQFSSVLWLLLKQFETGF